jgi:hypothetical protein
MDSCGLQVVHRVLVVQCALLICMVTMLTGALLVVRCVDIRTVSVLGEIRFVSPVQVLTLGLVLGVHGVMCCFMSCMDLVQRAVRLAVALVLSGR